MEAHADCPFCEIIKRDGLDNREVYRDDYTVAFLPPEPATLGHTLVVPRQHVTDIWSLDGDTAAYLAQATVRVSNAVKRAVEPDGLNIIQSNGEVASQTVFHLHVHIVPRWPNDPVGHIWPPKTRYSETDKDEVWERLRHECQKARDAVPQPKAKVMVDPDDRRKHLDFIQAVVTRMSAASSTAKSWLLPVITVTYGYALTKKADSVATLGMAAVFLFAFLDANYLRKEKSYRRLYDTVARNTRNVPLFSLDPSEVDDPTTPVATFLQRLGRRLMHWFPDRSVWLSWSIAPFYGGLAIIGVTIILITR